MRENLFNLRKKMGYTKAYTAKEIGLSEKQYSRLEAGTSDGSMKVWCKLKQLLHAKSIDWLLEQSD